MTSISIALRATILLVALTGVVYWLDGCSNSNPSVTVGKSMLIEPLKAAGKIQVGMTSEDVFRELGQSDIAKKSGYSKLGIGWIDYPGPDRQGAVRAVNCGHPWPTLHALIKAFKGPTVEGMGMGSSRADVLKVFGQPTKIVSKEDSRPWASMRKGLPSPSLTRRFII